MTDYTINFGLSDERTVRWPFLLGFVITLMLTMGMLIADAEAATCPNATYTADRVMHCNDGLFYSHGFEP